MDLLQQLFDFYLVLLCLFCKLANPKPLRKLWDFDFGIACALANHAGPLFERRPTVIKLSHLADVFHGERSAVPLAALQIYAETLLSNEPLPWA